VGGPRRPEHAEGVVGPEVLVISAHPGGLRLGEPQDVVDEEVGRADRGLDLRLDVAGYVAGLVGQGVASARPQIRA
jgi:hypothetical protein